MPDLARVKANDISPPPGWALMERRLIADMEESADYFTSKYTYPDGNVYYTQDVDDIYEIRHNWGLFYAMGADKRILDMASAGWNAATRYYDDSVAAGTRGPAHPFYMPQLHNEYWNLNVPYNSDWFHMGEGNQAFYDFGLADPTVPENVRRAIRFAALYMGEEPEAPNYDPEHKIIRSPFHGGSGPLLSLDDPQRPDLIHSTGVTTGKVELVRAWLNRHSMGDYFHRSRPAMSEKPGGLTTLYPHVKDLELDWHKDPKRRDEIIRLFEQVALNGDEPSNLGATALVTNTYLYTGDEKYKKWVLDYVEVWMDRIKKNNGILPDNVGPTGKIGEQRQGQWWGGIHGWNSAELAANRLMIYPTIAAECALLLSGDYGYLELIRSQLKMLLEQSITREDGQLLVPMRHGPDGWYDHQPMKVYEPAHLYHASMSPEDYELISRLRDGEQDRDWNEVAPQRDRRSGDSEYARFQFYDGKNPQWPEKVLGAEHQWITAIYEGMRADSRDAATIIEDNHWPPYNPDMPGRRDYGCEAANPVMAKGLTQVTMGSPQNVYVGGLCRAQVRYFDPDRGRPGLPPDVAALVDELKPDATGIRLVNLDRNRSRNLIVQAGAFGEHRFTDLRYAETVKQQPIENPGGRMMEDGAISRRTVPVNGKYFAVELPPSTSVRLEAGMQRFVNDPSYAFPWHGGRVPVS